MGERELPLQKCFKVDEKGEIIKGSIVPHQVKFYVSEIGEIDIEGLDETTQVEVESLH